MAVIDKKGKFVARSHGAEKYLGEQARPELVAAAAGAKEGLIRHFTLEGVESYDAFARSSMPPCSRSTAHRVGPMAHVEKDPKQPQLERGHRACDN